jgi:F-type H+-transporting ATPase subunit b
MLNVDLSVLVTVVYVIVLYLVLSRIFFRPVTEILKQRGELIDGRLEDSRKRLEVVERKTSEYENTLRAARAEIYHQQELRREHALNEKADLIAKAKTEGEASIRNARNRLSAEAEAAKANIAAEVEVLADRLTATLLRD